MTSAKAIRWAFICLAAVVAVFFLLNAANNVLSYVPFTSQWNARKAVAKVERLEGQVSSLEATATGNAEIGQAAETLHSQTVVIREITAEAQVEARNAPDADTPLTDERANRLRAADERLCVSSGLCPAAAADAP